MGEFGRFSRVLLVAVLTSAWLGTAHAHNIKLDLALWGPFFNAATCQGVIGHATARCIAAAVAARATCRRAELEGAACDEAAVDATVQAARSHALDRVEAGCSSQQLNSLGFIDYRDAENDVISACRELDTAAESAVYGPAMIGGTVSGVDGAEQECMGQAGNMVAKLLRVAFHARMRAFGQMAANDLTLAEKEALLQRSERRITRTVTQLQQRLRAWCSEAEFNAIYGRTVHAFLDGVAQRSDCLTGWTYAQNAVLCPPAVCGNGIKEPGEECDDGNNDEGDGCRNDCMLTECEAFASTYDLIQRAIFENRGCTNGACHGKDNPEGGLDLRAGASYGNLIDVPSTTAPGWKRVDPGSRETSLLWRILAAKTDPDHWREGPFSRPMPLDPFPAIKAEELEALRLWIHNGTPRTGSVAGTGDLLNACLPPAEPIQIPPLAPPASTEGIQMHMPAWELEAHSESEVCFSSYYDFTGKIPDEYLSNDGQRFRYRKIEIRQDPLSHHLIVDIYRGTEAANDPIWGEYSCKGGPKKGQKCDPLNLGFCGDGGDCATAPDDKAIACIGFGPQNGFNTLTMGGFAFTQETTSQFNFPDGVYDELPLKGTILWNSHAFNVTNRTGTLEGWVNIYFPAPHEQQHLQAQIFDVSRIFWTPLTRIFSGLPELAPFEKFEICQIHVFERPEENPFAPVVQANQTVHLFEISGHTHEHGKRFQIFRGAFTCNGGTNAGKACSPNNADMCPDGTCLEATGRDPDESLLYTNFIYNDPVVVRFNPPLLIPGSASRPDRSLTYCAAYDNGTVPNIQSVKRRSTSPAAGSILGIPLGGPCDVSKTRCIGGPHHNELCNGDNAVCGAGDGDCDACPLTGGFRTKDEMFILFGNFWVE